jgi:hypothetical protein
MPSIKQDLTADQVTNLLVGARHKEDFCVSECKVGQSWGKNVCRRFDLWVMRRSYTKPCYFGYEIKVSRADFMQDEKWQEYLPYCNQFSFVTPWGLVDPSEIPEEAGLIWVSKNLRKTYVKKKAPHRKIEDPVSLMKYVMMSRTRVSTERSPDQERISHIRDWLDQKRELQYLGHELARNLKHFVKKVQDENDKLKIKIHKLEEVRDFWVDTLGCKENELSSVYSYSIQRTNEFKAAALREKLPYDFIQKVRDAERMLGQLAYLEHSLKEVREIALNEQKGPDE